MVAFAGLVAKVTEGSFLIGAHLHWRVIMIEPKRYATGAQLRLSDGRMADVSIGRFIAQGSPSRAELIVHG